MRRTLCSVIVALGLLWALAPAASASDEWCATDPMVMIRTPSGANVNVFVFEYALGVQHLTALKASTIGQSVQPTADGLGTLVTLSVLVPDDQYATGFPTRADVRDKPNDPIMAAASGVSGQPMLLQFTLNVP